MPTTTRGGRVATGVGADRRATIVSAPGPRAERARARLLEAARVVFAERGYLDTTVAHIVDEAGVARGSFYTYFESKVDVFRHLAATIDRDIVANVAGVARPKDADPVVTLAESNRNYLAVVHANADLYRLVEQVAEFDEVVRAARQRSRQGHIDRVASTIRRWQSRGLADRSLDPVDTATALVAMLSGVARWVAVERTATEGDLDRHAASLTELWVRAVAPRR